MTDIHPLIAQLVRARQARGLSQQALADRLSVTQTALSYWENGNRDISLSKLTAWADALGVALGAEPNVRLTRVIAVIEEYERFPWDVTVPVSVFRKALEGRS